MRRESLSFCIEDSCGNFRDNDNMYREVWEERNLEESRSFFSFKYISS